MKKIKLLFLTSFLLISCGTFKHLTPEEIKAMTTTYINENYDLVFSSAVSLVQSQGFLITDADKTTGFIIASRQEDNDLAIVSKILFGSATESSTAQASFFIQKLRDDLTEVKLTLYQGNVSSDLIGESQTESKTVTNSIVTKPKVYQNWFAALEKEVENRKAMMQQSSVN
ncbi:MAG TPA: hypothetical protein H9922_02840 [Candidatus Phocaeicola caecigallinarum]|nr:hypothetical protein [Candidatus Phocaeicola caecigallinarum]